MSAYVLDSRRGKSRPAWADPIASELDLVERKLKSTVSSDVPVAFELAIHLFSAGGKRIRPTLVILSALACGGGAAIDRAVGLAAAAELVHAASLVHDDVVDETTERRGVPTASAEWGNKISVLGGDFLLAKGLTLLAADCDAEVLRIFSSAAVKMTESEMLQASSEGSLAAWEREYWRIIDGKTAKFMSACCEFGAVLSGAEPDARRAVVEYGQEIGLAFQITDDVLDLTGDPARTGKDIGTDLTHGKFTLPVLLALENLDGDDRKEMLSCIYEGLLSLEHAQRVAKLVIDCGAAEMAREVAMDHARKACEQLVALPPSVYRDALETLAFSMTSREV